MGSSFVDDQTSFKIKDTRNGTNGDEGYASYTAVERYREAKPADFSLHHNKFLVQSAADLHGDSMKKKLDPIRTFDRAPRSLLSSPSSEPSRRPPHDPRLPPALNVPVQLPIHSCSMLDVPARGLTDTPVFSASSSRPTAFCPLATDQRQLKAQRMLMCEGFPNKPKKFEKAEKLSAHEEEKRHERSFCGNRYKNKNEMGRHQNSLHVRRHSWSCSALSGYDRGFHDSTNRPGEADACGYCGDEFPRSGRGPGSGALSGGVMPKHATDQDWHERIRHLQEVHKFQECNSSNKFYRVDHFRQHLKHSHAGTSGKLANMLENACMMDEDPTPR